MDRYCPQRPSYCGSMPTPGTPSFQLLLRANKAERLRACAYEAGRRDLHGVAVLWFAEDYAGTTKGGIPSQPQTGTRDYARPWTGWESTRPKYFQSPSRSSQVSVPPTWSRDHKSSASVEFGHHVYPIAERLCLPRCRNGLVQSVSSFAPTLEQPGDSFLFRGVRGGHCHLWPAENFQHRSRSTIYLQGVCECDSQ